MQNMQAQAAKVAAISLSKLLACEFQAARRIVSGLSPQMHEGQYAGGCSQQRAPRVADETQYAIIEPDAKTRALMRQGTRPGTLARMERKMKEEFGQSYTPLLYPDKKSGYDFAS